MNSLSTVTAAAVAIAGFIAPPAQQITNTVSFARVSRDGAPTYSETAAKAPALFITKFNETAKFVREPTQNLEKLFEKADIPNSSGYHVIQSSLDFLKLGGHPVLRVLNEIIYDPDEDLNSLALTFLIEASPEEAFALGNQLTRRLIRNGAPDTSNLVVFVDINGAKV